ncbi:hypothetical protein X927_00285 [Petrotoga mexicana DSM 14811]|uniref:Uncharacterized protein n=1 Tax=Petrotoga mexicana DSM 14811 TaxID=1122954 RepID=A0A2K1PFJ1_9BACT|nr:hypothetical protein X927_00285 [Petrotoga mexicana DSM 14811]
MPFFNLGGLFPIKKGIKGPPFIFLKSTNLAKNLKPRRRGICLQKSL